nr:SCO5717 family growth-regulating ATPase [Streptomyces katrae]
MTGEFTIDYTPPAWYTQSPPPAPAAGVPGLPEGSGFEPHRQADAPAGGRGLALDDADRRAGAAR